MRLAADGENRKENSITSHIIKNSRFPGVSYEKVSLLYLVFEIDLNLYFL